MDARIRRVTALAALIGTVLFGAAGAQAEPTVKALEAAGWEVKGDTAALDEVAAAYKKLDTLSSYRSKFTGSTSTAISEIVQPNSFHSITQAGSVTMEVIIVNGQGRARTTGVPSVPSTWRCFDPTPPNAPNLPDTGHGTVDVSRGPNTTIGGIPVRVYETVYTFLVSGQPATLKNTMYVGAETGLPVRTVTVSSTGESTTDYYDFGAKVEITLPPCG